MKWFYGFPHMHFHKGKLKLATYRLNSTALAAYGDPQGHLRLTATQLKTGLQEQLSE
jgi:hypothetical protein